MATFVVRINKKLRREDEDALKEQIKQGLEDGFLYLPTFVDLWRLDDEDKIIIRGIEWTKGGKGDKWQSIASTKATMAR